jgi:transcriptional regulator with XRE-family HTH domain
MGRPKAQELKPKFKPLLKLRTLRKARGWTQEDLGSEAARFFPSDEGRDEIAPNSISQYECGHRKPSFSTLWALAKALDVFVSDIIDLDELLHLHLFDIIKVADEVLERDIQDAEKRQLVRELLTIIVKQSGLPPLDNTTK